MAIPQWKKERTCGASGCTERFAPKRRGQKYHSDECRYRAWNEERVSFRIDSNSIKRRSLKPNAKNEAVRAMRYFRDLSTEARKIVMQWCEEETRAAKQRARECARIERFIEAEHWRALSVYVQQLKHFLSR